MIGILEDLLELLEDIAGYILYAIESVINLFFSGIQAIFNAATSLIPLPGIPVPGFISEINWFFPIGQIVAIMIPIVSGYILFLAVRWIYKWAGEL